MFLSRSAFVGATPANGKEADGVADVAKQLFLDGFVNWGRIVCLVAYGAALLRRPNAAVSAPTSAQARGIGNAIAAHIINDHMDWFVANSGWVRHVIFLLSCVS